MINSNLGGVSASDVNRRQRSIHKDGHMENAAKSSQIQLRHAGDWLQMINTELHLMCQITLKTELPKQGRHAKGVQTIQLNVDKLHEIALNFTLLTQIRAPNYVIFPQDQTVTPAKPAFGHSNGWLWTNHQCWTTKSNIIHMLKRLFIIVYKYSSN